MTAALLPHRRAIGTIRREIRQWEATCRRYRWWGLHDEAAETRVAELKAELWRDWRIGS